MNDPLMTKKVCLSQTKKSTCLKWDSWPVNIICTGLKWHNDIITCHIPLKARNYLSLRDRRVGMEQKSQLHPPLKIKTIWSELFGLFPVKHLTINFKTELKINLPANTLNKLIIKQFYLNPSYHATKWKGPLKVYIHPV